MKATGLIVFAAALLVSAWPGLAAGQRSPRSGIVLGVHLNATALWASRDSGSPAGADAGVGGGFRVGFALASFATLFYSAEGARLPLGDGVGRNQFRHTDWGVRLHVRPVGVTPWLELTRSSRSGVVAVGAEQGREEVWGRGLGMGLGVTTPLATAFGLELGLHVAAGDFDELAGLPPEERFRYSGTSARVRVGLNWWPSLTRRASPGGGRKLPHR